LSKDKNDFESSVVTHSRFLRTMLLVHVSDALMDFVAKRLVIAALIRLDLLSAHTFIKVLGLLMQTVQSNWTYKNFT